MNNNLSLELWNSSNNTSVAPDVVSLSYPLYVGYIGASVAIVCFGSVFLPVKRFETGDGMFFQWVLCTTIWMAGLITNSSTGFPTFHPLAMLGGALWATGNIMVVPIIKTIGYGQGLMIWASLTMLTGWASGRFGWFGINQQTVTYSLMNYIGVGVCILSTVMVVLIKSETQLRVNDPPAGSTNSHNDVSSQMSVKEMKPDKDNTLSFLESMSLLQRRMLGVLFCVVSGFFYGVNFVPVIYIKDNFENTSQNDIDYVFAHFSGTFCASTVYFLIYSAVKRNKPTLYPQAVLPAVLSGVVWSFADIGWFVANDSLSQSISFPTVTGGPPIIASLWGIYFKEIRGRRNILILAAAALINITGTALIGVSK